MGQLTNLRDPAYWENGSVGGDGTGIGTKTYDDIKISSTTRIRTKNLVYVGGGSITVSFENSGYQVYLDGYDSDGMTTGYAGWGSSLTLSNAHYASIVVRKGSGSKVITPEEIANTDILVYTSVETGTSFLDKLGLAHFWSKLKSFFVKGNARVFTGTCSTDAATAEKEVVCDDFSSSDLIPGAIITVSFTTTNSAAIANLALDVNGTGAKPIKYIYNGSLANIPDKPYIKAGQMYQFYYDGSHWVVQMMYNTNTNDTTYGYCRFAYGRFIPTTALYRYMICLTKDETHVIPVNTVSDGYKSTTKVLTTDTFNPFAPIYYYSATTTVAAGALIPVAYFWYAYSIVDYRYSFNEGTTLTVNKDVYIKATLVSPTEARLASDPIVQGLPTTDDGYIYIRLGHTYENYRGSIALDHPVYIFKNGAIRTLSGYADDAGTVNGHTVSTDNAEENQNAYSHLEFGTASTPSTFDAASKTDTLKIYAGDNISIAADSSNKSITISSDQGSGEPNQNAFSNVKVHTGGSYTTIAADSETDTLNLDFGLGINYSANASTDTVTISTAESYGTVKVGSTNVTAANPAATLTLDAGKNISLTPDATNHKVTIATTGLGTAATKNYTTDASSDHNADIPTVNAVRSLLTNTVTIEPVTATGVNSVTVARFRGYKMLGFMFCSGAINIPATFSNGNNVLKLSDAAESTKPFDFVASSATASRPFTVSGDLVKVNASTPAGYYYFNFVARLAS